MFSAYSLNSVTFRFVVTKSENNLLEVNTIIETKNVNFFENIFPMKLSGEQQAQKTIRYESIKPYELVIRSKRDRKDKNLGDGFYTFLIDEDPITYKEAIPSSDALLCKEALNSEIKSIMYNSNYVKRPTKKL